jgi:hypothetical protein
VVRGCDCLLAEFVVVGAQAGVAAEIQKSRPLEFHRGADRAQDAGATREGCTATMGLGGPRVTTALRELKVVRAQA